MNFPCCPLAALILLLAASAPTLAQKATIKFVVPYPAGGAADQITRMVAHETLVVLGTPTIVDNKALKKPELVEKLRNIGVVPMPGSPEVFAKFIADYRGNWTPLAKSLGVKAD